MCQALQISPLHQLIHLISMTIRMLLLHIINQISPMKAQKD